MTLPVTHADMPQDISRAPGTRSLRETSPSPAGDRLSFAKLFNILRRRMWLVISIAVAVFVIGLLITLWQPKIYTADAIVRLTGSNRELAAKVGDEAEPTMAGDADVATEIQVVGSLGMAREIVRKYDLVNNRQFNPFVNPPASTLSRLLGRDGSSIDPRKLNPEQRQKMEDQLVRYLRSGLGATRIGTSYSIGIGYRHHDPEMAAMLANAYANEYAQSQITEKKTATSEAIGFLRDKVEELRTQATADFAEVQNYRIRNGLPSTTGASLTEQDISVYNQQAATARAEAAADAARLETARAQLRSGSMGDDVGEALESSVVSSLRSQRAIWRPPSGPSARAAGNDRSRQADPGRDRPRHLEPRGQGRGIVAATGLAFRNAGFGKGAVAHQLQGHGGARRPAAARRSVAGSL